MLRRNARLLFGFCFLFATGWKLFSADFMNSAFLEHTYLTDRRFWSLVMWTTGFPPDLINQNAEILLQARGDVLFDPAFVPPREALLANSPAIQTLAIGGTWYTILIEGAIALTFLGGLFFRFLDRLRNAALLLFFLTTYAVATVIGFGWLLAIIGYAQCRRDER